MKPRLKVLFLPRWYPSRNDPMTGLFIQRQAEALTKHCDVAVIYIQAENDCPNKFEVDFAVENEVRVLRVYYREPDRGLCYLRYLQKYYRYFRATFRALKSIRQFNPDILHAHILTRMGMVAFKLSRSWKKPFLISEHWSRYFPEQNTYKGIIRKWMTRFVVGKADAIVAVSEVLKKSMINRKLYNPRYYIIPNVVDTGIFIPSPGKEKKSRKRIIHVSCFEDKSKNLTGFLRAVKSLSSRRNDFECLVVGDGPDYDEIVQYSKSLGIQDSLLVFAGMKTDGDLVEAYQSSDFLVLSSNYETFGTVLIEGLSCGLPVVATRVGIVPEIITAENGLIVPPGDEDAMEDAINQMIDRIDCYDLQKIRSTVIDRFSKETVADALYNLYREIVL